MERRLLIEHGASMNTDALLRIAAIADRQHGVVSRLDALRCGLRDEDIRALRRWRQWRRLFRDTYLVDADLTNGVPRVAWFCAALLSHGPYAFLVGPTAAEIHGLNGLPSQPSTIWLGQLPVSSRQIRQAQTGTDRDRPDEGQPMRVIVRQIVLTANELTEVDGLSTTVPWRALADTVVGLDRAHALALLDSAVHLGQVSIDDVERLGELCAGRRGVQRLRTLLPLVDGRAESPLETRIRLACIDGGVPPDDLQYAVRDHWGQILGRADLAWWKGRRRPLVAEADGAGPHSRPEALFRDRHRANDFTLADVDMVRFTWADSRHSGYVSSVVRAALARDAA
jgi:hypothetical protein